MRLGLLGGSFNPIHLCHLSIAEAAQRLLSLDRVLFIPTGDPPHKQTGSLAPAAHRYRMVELAIQDHPTFTAGDIEIRRLGKSYTIDTIDALQRDYGPTTELFFIIGLDAFLDLPSWRDAERLLRACRFVVCSRPNVRFDALAALPLLDGLRVDDLRRLDRGEQDRLDGRLTTGAEVTCLRLPPCGISASEVRARIRRGATPANLLPHQVESYILREGLYREDRDRT